MVAKLFKLTYQSTSSGFRKHVLTQETENASWNPSEHNQGIKQLTTWIQGSYFKTNLMH